MPKRTLGESFLYAFEGLFYAWSTQRNMKIHLLAGVFVSGVGFMVNLNTYEWLFTLLAIDLVITAEMVNTAIEGSVDLASKRYNPVARMAKNVAAGAVFVSAAFSLLVGIIVFGPKIPFLIETIAGGAYRSLPFWIWIFMLMAIAYSVLVSSKRKVESNWK